MSKLSDWKFFWKGEKKPRPPRKVEVGRADITIKEVDGTVHVVSLDGVYMGENPFNSSEDWIVSAEIAFQTWRKIGGETGTIGVGNYRFVPLCNIKSINVKFSEHWVEVQ